MLKIAVYVGVGLVSGAAILYALVSSLTTSISVKPPSNSNGSLAVDSLKLLIVLSRHGNRGSGFDYPGDPYPMNDTRYWPYGANGLTPKGRKQMYNLGLKVRSLYAGFLPVTYRSEDIRATSTYMDRLLMSGEAFLAGLYSPRGLQIWKSGLEWQPSALYSDSPDRSVDLFVWPTEPCPYIENYDTTQFGTLIDQKFGAMFKNVSEYVQNVTGVDTSSFNGSDLAFVLWDKISNEVSEGYTVPEWTRRFYPEQLLPYATEQYKLTASGTDKISRLVAGEMFEEMLNTMTQKINGSLTPDRKMIFYSGHDTSIIAIQHILGVSHDVMVAVVRPGSAILIELHQENDTQQYYIQARYIDGADLDKVPHVFNITPDFASVVNNSLKYIHVDFQKECQELDTNLDFASL